MTDSENFTPEDHAWIAILRRSPEVTEKMLKAGGFPERIIRTWRRWSPVDDPSPRIPLTLNPDGTAEPEHICGEDCPYCREVDVDTSQLKGQAPGNLKPPTSWKSLAPDNMQSLLDRIRELEAKNQRILGQSLKLQDEFFQSECALKAERALRTKLEGELREVDSILGNRSALDECKTRGEKIHKCVAVAFTADAAKKELATERAEHEELKEKHAAWCEDVARQTRNCERQISEEKEEHDKTKKDLERWRGQVGFLNSKLDDTHGNRCFKCGETVSKPEDYKDLECQLSEEKAAHEKTKAELDKATVACHQEHGVHYSWVHKSKDLERQLSEERAARERAEACLEKLDNKIIRSLEGELRQAEIALAEERERREAVEKELAEFMRQSSVIYRDMYARAERAEAEVKAWEARNLDAEIPALIKDTEGVLKSRANWQLAHDALSERVKSAEKERDDLRAELFAMREAR